MEAAFFRVGARVDGDSRMRGEGSQARQNPPSTHPTSAHLDALQHELAEVGPRLCGGRLPRAHVHDALRVGVGGGAAELDRGVLAVLAHGELPPAHPDAARQRDAERARHAPRLARRAARLPRELPLRRGGGRAAVRHDLLQHRSHAAGCHGRRRGKRQSGRSCVPPLVGWAPSPSPLHEERRRGEQRAAARRTLRPRGATRHAARPLVRPLRGASLCSRGGTARHRCAFPRARPRWCSCAPSVSLRRAPAWRLERCAKQRSFRIRRFFNFFFYIFMS